MEQGCRGAIHRGASAELRRPSRGNKKARRDREKCSHRDGLLRAINGRLFRLDSACLHFFADFEMAALNCELCLVIQLLVPLAE